MNITNLSVLDKCLKISTGEHHDVRTYNFISSLVTSLRLSEDQAFLFIYLTSVNLQISHRPSYEGKKWQKVGK